MGDGAHADVAAGAKVEELLVVQSVGIVVVHEREEAQGPVDDRLGGRAEAFGEALEVETQNVLFVEDLRSKGVGGWVWVGAGVGGWVWVGGRAGDWVGEGEGEGGAGRGWGRGRG